MSEQAEPVQSGQTSTAKHFEGMKVYIYDKSHPHFDERGTVTDSTIKSTGQYEIELDGCKHGVRACGAMRNQFAIITELDKSQGIIKTKMGRPPKLNDDERFNVRAALDEYISKNDDPTLVGFCAWNPIAIQHRITKDNLYDWDDFSELRKRAVEKQEAYLIKNAGNNSYNPTIAIFRLKQPQHGYRDRYETDVTSNGESINLTPEQAEQALRLRAERAAN